MTFAPKFDERGFPIAQHACVDDFFLQRGPRVERARLGCCVFGEPGRPVVVVHPALSGTSKMWTPARPTQGDGWWSRCVGPKRFIDTDQFTVICVDHFGGNGESTSATDLGELAGRVTLGDSVHLTARMLRQAGVEQIHAIVGGSIGGGQALEWLFQEEIPVRRLLDISGNNSRRGVAPDFFRLQVELLSGRPEVLPTIRSELRAHAADLLGKTPAFDQVFEHVDDKLAILASAYDPIETLRIARQIGFFRFVTPLFFQRRWDEDTRRLSDESLAIAGTVSWLEHQGARFAQRFSPEAMQALARMEAEAEPHNAAEVSARIQTTGCHLVGFAVGGDVLFDAAEQFAFYRDVRDNLPADKQHLVDIQFAYDEVNGHDHFLSERFLDNVPRLAKSLCDAPELDGFETRAIHKGQGYRDTTGAVIPPIYLTSTFESGNRGGFDYTRSGNPNFRNLEEVCASLEERVGKKGKTVDVYVNVDVDDSVCDSRVSFRDTVTSSGA
jgi:homoserine acetyltransferase